MIRGIPKKWKLTPLFPSHQLITLSVQSWPKSIHTRQQWMAISLFWSNYCSNPLNFTNKSIVNKLSLSQMGRRKDYDHLSLSYKWVVLCLLSQLCLTYSIPGPQTSFIFNRKPPVSCSPPNFSRAESSGCFAVPNASQQGSLCGHPHHIQIEKWAKKVCINNLVQSAEMLLYFCMTSSLPFGIGSCWCTVKKKRGRERDSSQLH